MLLEYEDRHPETPRLESAISRREGVMYSIFAHIVIVLAIMYVPTIPWVREAIEQARAAAVTEQRLLEEQQRQDPRFVFVQPRIDTPAPAPPPRAELSDQDRMAQALERAPDPTNPLPFSRGNSTDRTEAQLERERPRGDGPGTQPSQPSDATPAAGDGNGTAPPLANDAAKTGYLKPDSAGGATAPAGGALGQALQNLQRYVQRESFDNPTGGGGAFGPSIQFDTKGVEFGPWIRRFIAQIKRNWFVPYAAMSFRGHVTLTFNVHRDGRITDLTVMQPSQVDAFNSSAFNALQGSNPTQPLPPEYPSDKAFFTVTFYYNESPPQ
jgi:TonB family protein